MLQPNNLLLAALIIAAAYAWSRLDFSVPRVLRVPARASRALVASLGWTLVVLVAGYSVGGILGGRTQIAKSGTVRYVWRERQPDRFWREIVLQTLVGAGTGLTLVALATRRGRHAVR